MKRRFNPDLKKDWTPRTVATPLPAAPIIAIALHLSEEAKATNEALREAAGHALKSLPGARLACLNVLKQSYISNDTMLDGEGHNKHVNRLVALQDWAQPLKLREGRVTFHALEAVEPGGGDIGYAELVQVDTILVERTGPAGAGVRCWAAYPRRRWRARRAAPVTVVRGKRPVEAGFAGSEPEPGRCTARVPDPIGRGIWPLGALVALRGQMRSARLLPPSAGKRPPHPNPSPQGERGA